MILHVLRALFVLLMAAVGWLYLTRASQLVGAHPGQIDVSHAWIAFPIAITVAVLFVAIDVLAPRRKLAIFAGTFFGLVVGIAISYALSFVVELLLDQYAAMVTASASKNVFPEEQRIAVRQFVDLVVGIVCCYLAISFILQTKDDFRFIIPFVEFSKQTKGARPMLLDTSVLIDGRIADIADTGLLESQIVVPHFVLEELQAVADSPDRLKRNRGRRGLDVLARLRAATRADVALYESPHEEGEGGVDQRLMQLAKRLNARVLTNDYNLNKVAQLTGVDVINVNDLGAALRPVVLPGEKMRVQIVKPGEETGQGVGYLEDGTMVVVEQARPHLNEEVEFTVTRALQTSAGRMIFGRMGPAEAPPPGPQRPRNRAETAR